MEFRPRDLSTSLLSLHPPSPSQMPVSDADARSSLFSSNCYRFRCLWSCFWLVYNCVYVASLSWDVALHKHLSLEPNILHEASIHVYHLIAKYKSCHRRVVWRIIQIFTNPYIIISWAKLIFQWSDWRNVNVSVRCLSARINRMNK